MQSYNAFKFQRISHWINIGSDIIPFWRKINFYVHRILHQNPFISAEIYEKIAYFFFTIDWWWIWDSLCFQEGNFAKKKIKSGKIMHSVYVYMENQFKLCLYISDCEREGEKTYFSSFNSYNLFEEKFQEFTITRYANSWWREKHLILNLFHYFPFQHCQHVEVTVDFSFNIHLISKLYMHLISFHMKFYTLFTHIKK